MEEKYEFLNYLLTKYVKMRKDCSARKRCKSQIDLLMTAMVFKNNGKI